MTDPSILVAEKIVANPTNAPEAISYQDGAVVSKEILKTPGATVTLFAFDIGQGLSEHSTPFNALVQVIDGEAEIIIDNISYLVKINEMIIMPANHPHALKANKRFKMLLTMTR